MSNKIIIIIAAIIITSLIITGCTEEDNNNDDLNGEIDKDNDEKNLEPIAVIGKIQDSGIRIVEIEFIGVGYDPDGKIILYEWDFNGDGIYDWKSNITGNTTYEYMNVGAYNISFKVTDNDGAYDINYTKMIIYQGLPPTHKIWFSNLENGYVINSTFNIMGDAKKSHSEDKILSVQISINNSNWINVTYWEVSDMYYEWYYIFNTTILLNGEYDIFIKAVGETYGEIIETIMIEIKN